MARALHMERSMRRMWMVMLLSMTPGLALAGANTGAKAPMGKPLHQLKFRPSSALPASVTGYPIGKRYFEDTPRERLLHALSRVGSVEQLAQHESLQAAVDAETPQRTERVTKTLHPERLRNRVARKVAKALSRGETHYDAQVRADIAASLESDRASLTAKVEHLAAVDRELERLPEEVTGGLRIGSPWKNPLLQDWSALQKEVLGVVQLLDNATPAKPASATAASRQALRTGRPERITRDTPSFLYRLGEGVLSLIDPDVGRQILVNRRNNPRSY